jgi:hypothetical protein
MNQRTLWLLCLVLITSSSCFLSATPLLTERASQETEKNRPATCKDLAQCKFTVDESMLQKYL